MKKILYIVLVVCIPFMLLTACGTPKADKTLATNSVSIKEQSLIVYPSLDKEEIQGFAESELAPEGFVVPGDLKLFGSVPIGVTFLPEDHQQDFSYRVYRYNLRDANGEELWIDISHCGVPGWNTKSMMEFFPQTNLSVTSGMKDMFLLETEDTGWIYRNDASYYYIHGKLNTVIFYAGDIEFAITYMPENPMDGEDTLLKRMLSINEGEASAAIKEFRWVILCRGIGKWLVPTGIGVGVVALGVTGFVVWKKKKRKATNTTESPEPQPVDTPE